MEYSINRLAKLAGISTRTLRYYDEIGLLKPKRISSNGYRVYGKKEVDLLQQILFYRELSVPLEEIRKIITAGDYDPVAVLEGHLAALKAERERIDLLIRNVEKTILDARGEINMSDREKFEGFRRQLIEDNERKYGKEAREKYGDEAIDRSNAKLMKMTEEEYKRMQQLSEQLNKTLKAAVEQGDPSGELAQKAAAMHREWLCFFWDSYSKEAHMGLAQMYMDDHRFKKYYDDIVPGGAEFLRDAIKIYCERQ